MLQALGLRLVALPAPFPLAERLAAGLERLPHPSLTRGDVRLLKTDKIAGDLPTPGPLGVAARPLDDGLPASLGVSCWRGKWMLGGARHGSSERCRDGHQDRSTRAADDAGAVT
jgi:hypothetical protein